MGASGEGSSTHNRILLGLVLGAAAGVAANVAAGEDPQARRWVQLFVEGVAHPVGQIFLRLLFLVVLPLVFASLAAGVASLGDLGRLGRLGGRTLLFFLATSTFSAALGIAAMNLVRPGAGFDPQVQAQLLREWADQASELAARSEAARPEDLLGTVNLVLDAFMPRNLLAAVVEMQMVPLIVFALLFGAALTRLPDARRLAMVRWLEALADAMVAIVGFAMRIAAPAVFCLIFAATARFGLELLGKLGLYVALILACYLVQMAVFYPAVLLLLARRRPLEFLRRAVPVIATAFSTSSSSATLPESIRVAETSLGVRPGVAGFVLPLGATMNMNGTALFEGAVVLFVAQVFGVQLDLLDQVLVVALCVLTSIGAAGVPGGSLPLLMVVMAQVGVPSGGIALVIGVDRLLDMGRTVVNVSGDLVCAAYVEQVERDAEAAGPS